MVRTQKDLFSLLQEREKVEVKQYDNTFGIVTPARTYYVRARSRTERTQWTNKVTAATLLLKSIDNPQQRSMMSSVPKLDQSDLLHALPKVLCTL
ncbi:hypothetical protein PSTG_19750 [Puccinia striiformis f. sp. tritici PST-78]|uniref:PH domain-containing protein n=1 Tax=Puccinia striiformis f. sp. tritici PST-78 TaxID=1165861 RepID=A0A0L0UIP4_9BASI|nr:hypothetical protein PSTG_19750 [Puccinia striiformis f. sp. tritici PST-78]